MHKMLRKGGRMIERTTRKKDKWEVRRGKKEGKIDLSLFLLDHMSNLALAKC